MGKKHILGTVKGPARYLSVLSPPGKPSLGEGRGETGKQKRLQSWVLLCERVSTRLTELSPWSMPSNWRVKTTYI